MKKLKLLHIALGDHNQGWWRAFEKNFETTHYNWLKHNGEPDKINRNILAQFNKVKPDIVFMQIQREGVVQLDTAAKLAKSAIVLNWTGDVRTPLPQWYVDLGRAITLSLFSNLRDVQLMRQQGVSADYLQVGFDPTVFTPFGKKGNYPPIVFLGSNYMDSHNFPLSSLRYQMAFDLLARYKNQFGVYGHGWKNVGAADVLLNQNEEAMAYRSSAIAINLSHFDYERYSSDRMPRIMGSGGFCLTHHFKGIEKDYHIGEHIATWNTIDDLIEKINYYSSHLYEREKIRMQGCKFIRETGTWDVRMQELKKLLNIDNG